MTASDAAAPPPSPDRGTDPEREAARRAARAARPRVLAVLAGVQLVGGIGIASAVSVIGLIARDLTGSQGWSGMGTTMMTLGGAVAALPLASAAARRGRRFGLSLGWFLAALGGAVAIAGAQLALFPLFLLGMVFFGVGSATGLQSRHGAADLAGDGTRGRDLSLVVWGTTVGSAAGPNLTGPGAAVAGFVGLDSLVGPLVLGTAAFAAAGTGIALLLRPDPLLLSRAAAGTTAQHAPATSRPRGSFAASLRAIAAEPRALLAITGMAASHAAMITVMTMTPVHMESGGAHLSVIGLTISLHIAGMYALSPLVGWLADRLGRVPVLLAGQALIVCAAALAGTAGNDPAQVTAGLVVLGLGWSFGLVSASALLAESLPPERRPQAQGTSDALMHSFGAAGSALSGATLVAFGFGPLNAVAAALTLPVLVLVLRARRRG